MSAGVKTKPRVPELRFPEFAGEWEEKRLGELMTFKNGVNADKSMYGSGYKFINVLDIIAGHPITHDSIIGRVEITEKEFAKNEVAYGDILFQRSSEVREETGQSNVYLDRDNSATFGGFVIRGKPIAEFDPCYFNELLKTASARKDITSRSGGSTRYNIGQESLSAVLVSVAPSLPEQEKIAGFLGAVDGKLGVLRDKHKRLERFKRGLMQKLFSRTLRFTRPDGTPYPDWEEKRLGDITNEKLSNGVFNDPAKVGSGYRLINVKDMYSEATIDPSNLSRIAIDESEFLSNKAEWGDVFFTRSSLVKEGIAHSNVLLSRAGDVTFDGHLIRLKPDLSIIVPKFLYYCLGADAMRRQFVARGKTGTMTTIGQADFISVRIEIPHPEEQQKIADALSALDAKIAAVSDKITRLENFKRGLLQKMFV